LALAPLDHFTFPQRGWCVCCYQNRFQVTDVNLIFLWHLTSQLGDMFLKNVYHSLNANEGKDEITFAKLK
jgi:hypothetical protein